MSMPIRYYNTLHRQVEEFIPLDPQGKQVKVYTCGPTVYNSSHIGNYRCYMFEDLLVRHLEFRGYNVQRVMNLTDVDDKTIRNSRKAGIPLQEYTAKYKQEFFRDLETLRIKPASTFTAATDPENVQKMIEMISKLVASGHAYQAEDKSVYFRIHSFKEYGKLAHLDPSQLLPGARVLQDEYEKENVADFALWKAWDEADGDVKWPSPWGPGRPGWHMECSAMATRLLGDQIDIHCGAVDNIFPHHEAEIAQSECCTGKKFVNYWMHCAHLRVDDKKMSKSLGNMFTLRDILDKGYTGREIRYVLISARYDVPLNFQVEQNISLEAARKALARIDEWHDRIQEHARDAKVEEPVEILNKTASGSATFGEALDDNLNISGALGHVFDVIRDTNKSLSDGKLTKGQAATIQQWWNRIDHVLQFSPDSQKIPENVTELLNQRAEARRNKDFTGSDRIRDQLQSMGWAVKDTKKGQEIRKLSQQPPAPSI